MSIWADDQSNRSHSVIGQFSYLSVMGVMVLMYKRKKLSYFLQKHGLQHDATWNGGPLYVLEDRLFRVANWEDQTREDLASKFSERRGNIAIFSPLKTSFHYKTTKSNLRLIRIFWFYIRRNRRSALVGGPPFGKISKNLELKLLWSYLPSTLWGITLPIQNKPEW